MTKPERPELVDLRARLALTEDAARPAAVAKRRASGQRTARENIADLLDPDSFREYGALAVAAQRSRRSPEELAQSSPADGVICGLGTVNAALFGAARAGAAVAAYDYTVFAGTQGFVGHQKIDRLFERAGEGRLPLVLFAEGGGGRPNDSDVYTVAGLDTPSFAALAALSGLVPRVGIASGRCFAGNAALLGTCDVIIATEDSNIGMAGPVMIEAGGLGKFTPEALGPIDVQAKNGVVDVRVKDEAEAVAVAKTYLAYFQGPTADWQAGPQELLRDALPENLRRPYKVWPILEALFDTGSLLELRREFARNLVTALGRVEGQPVGILANDSGHLAGALDADAADKAARFLQLCDAFGLPVVSLVDTPGFMAGPTAEATALVRHVSRMFVATANLTVPYFTVVLRRGYGLGAQAMAGGHFHAPFFTVAWPSGEFGGMNLEGAVRIGMKKELEAIADPAQREATAQAMIAEARRRGTAVNMASLLELDAVIDPADTRSWLISGLRSCGARAGRDGRRRVVDTW